MENLDILFEAFELYKSKSKLDASVERFKKFYSSFKGDKYEDITLTFSTCVIETDWIDAIEKGLPFIDKAIKEERQFIRNDGEVLPIEKIRKISKDSIQDLAKHSNYITHEPDPDTELLIPDKMLMIRKESDYAIYENRVLYATLIYLRDFVSSRLNKIKELTNRYEADTYAKKRLDLGNRKIEYDFHLYEIRNNDPIVSKKNSAVEIIKRLDDIMTNVLGLLKRPLMMELSKSELVSRPITKTNILRMNHNFRESLACFDYIANYSGDGYSIKTTVRHFNPFSIDMMDSFGEGAAILSFLTYIYANNLTDELKHKYQETLQKRKEDEENKTLAKLKSLKAKAKTDEITLTEYYILFENGYRILEKRFENIDREIKELTIAHEKEIAQLKGEFDKKLVEEQHKFEEEINALNAKKDAEIASLVENYTKTIDEIKSQSYNELQQLKNSFALEKSNLIEEHNKTVNELKDENKLLKDENKSLKEENDLLKSKIFGLLIKTNQAEDPQEMITEEKFDELEKTKILFDEYYKKAWNHAKKAIRKESLKIKKKEKKK